MKWVVFLCSIVVIAATAERDNLAFAADDAEVTLCSCTNEPIRTDAKAAACGALMDSLTPEETAEGVAACRAEKPASDDGPDLCFCLKTFTQEPELVAACEALIPKGVTPTRMNELLVNCSK